MAPLTADPGETTEPPPGGGSARVRPQAVAQGCSPLRIILAIVCSCMLVVPS